MNLFEVVATVYRNWPRISRTIDLLKPIVDAYQENSQELNENIRVLSEAFGARQPIDKGDVYSQAYDVEWIQRALNALLGYKLEVSGRYDGPTKRAVEEFQKRNGLDVDGWVGPETAAALEKEWKRLQWSSPAS